ncbi:MAG: hypothetical protein HOA57_02575 [Candidatus Magasanikbacteria bacterium]|jgi:hypothetical protein|nr:hypothetical protein [Candidatus Magasanikbacteria bacterium]MBT4314833.1 hypothetical protein [Candidatus Magasanikbacteria bacterium]MBT4547610.1 hypothetical protein [Candidatus Magasanikbacteria bacterium]MBT6819240.1 hypothetical protein [Candidatus Magasanikbacteria bacterium]
MVKIAKKFFTVSVVAMTIVWSVGLAALVPMVAVAEDACPELEAGDLYKTSAGTAVYILNADMESMYFPNAEVYKTWFVDYSGVEEISAACNELYPQGDPAGVNYRPGSYLVKRIDGPSVFAVLPGNMRTKITSEAVAKGLFGDAWASMVRDVHAFHWANYTTGAETLDVTLQNGMVVTVDGEKVYSVVDGMTYEVDGDYNGVLYTVSQAAFDSLEMGAETVTTGSLVEDPGQITASAGDDADDDTETPAVVGGDVTVSLSANTPDAGNVVVATDNVVFLKAILRASDDNDAVVNSVKIGRTGLGATGDFTSVTLYDGATKLGSTRTSWHSDGYMTYNISGGWTITAGTSKELTVVVNLLTAGTYNSIGILDLGLGNDGDVGGTPLYGNQMTGVSVTTGGVTITGVGTTGSKNIGTTDVALTKFKLAVNSVENSMFNAITLKNKAATNNAADDNLANIYLYQGADLLAGPVSMVSDKITFVLDEAFPISKSKNETFTVKGDIVNGAANTVEFVLDSTTDLNVIGDTYNTRLTVTDDNYDAATEGNIITIAGAELNVGLTSVALETADDSTDVEFGRLTLSSGSTDIKITSIQVDVDETDGADTGTFVIAVDDLELVDVVSGAAYSGTTASGVDTDAVTEDWVYTDEIYLSAGESITLLVRGDIPASTTAGEDDSYKLSVNTANITAETVPAGDSVSNFSVGTVTGKLITVRKPTLTVKATPMNTGNAVVNDSSVILFQGTMDATAGDVRIERAQFEATTTNLFAITNWSDMGFYLVSDAGEYELQQNITNSGMTADDLDFDTLDFTVASGDKATFVVKGSVASTVSTTANIVHIRMDGLTAKDVDNDDASVVNSAGTALDSAGNELDTTRILTLNSKGILYVQMRNADTSFDKDRVLMAGSDAWVGKLRMRADFEDIMVKDLKLTNSSAGDEDSVESVCLYSAMSAVAENLIGCTTVNSQLAFFDNINETVTMGTHDWYIYVATNEMGNAGAATADSQDLVQFGIVTSSGHLTAQGVESGDELAYYSSSAAAIAAGDIVFDLDVNGTFGEEADLTGTASTTIFYISGTKISNVELVSSYGGKTVASTIAGTGSTTVGIVAITVEAGSNTDANGNALKLGIDNFLFDMTKFASTSISGATIERIGGANGAVNLTVTGSSTGATTADIAGDWTMTSVTSTLGNDAFIDAGTTAYFALNANINSLSPTSNITNWIQVGLDDLKGGAADANNNIDWFDGYDTVYATASNFDYLLLDTTSIGGTKISAPTNN